MPLNIKFYISALISSYFFLVCPVQFSILFLFNRLIYFLIPFFQIVFRFW